jgi:hypothetical protein
MIAAGVFSAWFVVSVGFVLSFGRAVRPTPKPKQKLEFKKQEREAA